MGIQHNPYLDSYSSVSGVFQILPPDQDFKLIFVLQCTSEATTPLLLTLSFPSSLFTGEHLWTAVTEHLCSALQGGRAHTLTSRSSLCLGRAVEDKCHYGISSASDSSLITSWMRLEWFMPLTTLYGTILSAFSRPYMLFYKGQRTCDQCCCSLCADSPCASPALLKGHLWRGYTRTSPFSPALCQRCPLEICLLQKERRQCRILPWFLVNLGLGFRFRNCRSDSGSEFALCNWAEIPAQSLCVCSFPKQTYLLLSCKY